MLDPIDWSGEPRRSPKNLAASLAHTSRHSSRLSSVIESALSRPEQREHAVAGRLVMPENGGPIRSIITGRRVLVTGSYASRKAGRSQVFESMTERAFFMHCEVDTTVVDYRAQPFRFEFALDGRWRTYIADCVRLMEDGAVEVIELKSDLRDLRDEDYRAKLDGVRLLCERLGWRFMTVRRQHLDDWPILQRNVELIQQDRLSAFDERHIYRLTDLLAEEPATYDDAARVIDPGPAGRAILHAMMVARIVDIDLDRPLADETPVWLLQPGGRA